MMRWGIGFRIHHSSFLLHRFPSRVMDILNHRGGWIEVIAGGMFSGKSEELIRRVRRAEIARQRTQIFKPAIDNRFDAKRIISRDNRGIDAIAVANTAELRSSLVFG